jgi:hypothetical protein
MFAWTSAVFSIFQNKRQLLFVKHSVGSLSMLNPPKAEHFDS